MTEVKKWTTILSLLLLVGCDKGGDSKNLPPLTGAEAKLTVENQKLTSRPWCLQYNDEFGLERVYVLNFESGGSVMGSVHERDGEYVPGLQIEDEGGSGRWALNQDLVLTLEDPKGLRKDYFLEFQEEEVETREICLKKAQEGNCTALLKSCGE